MLKKLYYILRVIPKLGYWNVAYMAWYRFSMKTGIRKKFFPIDDSVKGPFFKSCEPIDNYPEEWKQKLKDRVDKIVSGNLTWFHYHEFEVGNPPNWFLNPFNGEVLNNPKKHWTELSDFDLNTGDIKIVWEPSRFDWVTDLARAYRVFGDLIYLDTLNKWIENWSKNNPVNQGPNWKCGQETSIRIFKLFTAATILEQENDINSRLQQLLFQHVERVSKNIRYAIAQDNNHGTSETAGLYIGSTWLLQQSGLESFQKQKLKKWKKKGRKLLEDRILKLIESEGTFAQKSVTYHRVVVDTLSVILHTMKVFDEPDFSDKVLDRIEKLGEWQVKMTIPENGDAPNIGSNDGAMFENLHECGYRDFRPSSQQLFGLLKNKKVYPDGAWNEPLFWRSNQPVIQMNYQPIQSSESQLLDNQFLIIKKDDFRCYLKIPNDKFRPDLDIFHLDVWHKGKNLLMDSGSYSYNAGEETKAFKSIGAHNSAQFGDHEPMPKISRFLNGEWIKPDDLEEPYEQDDFTKWTGAYSDYLGNHNRRSLEVSRSLIRIIDEIETKEPAFLRFHVPLDTYKSGESTFSMSNGILTLIGTQKLTLHSAEHSLFYMDKESHKVIEAKFEGNKIITEMKFDNR